MLLHIIQFGSSIFLLIQILFPLFDDIYFYFQNQQGCCSKEIKGGSRFGDRAINDFSTAHCCEYCLLSQSKCFLSARKIDSWPF